MTSSIITNRQSFQFTYLRVFSEGAFYLLKNFENQYLNFERIWGKRNSPKDIRKFSLTFMETVKSSNSFVVCMRSFFSYMKNIQCIFKHQREDFVVVYYLRVRLVIHASGLELEHSQSTHTYSMIVWVCVVWMYTYIQSNTSNKNHSEQRAFVDLRQLLI